MTGRLPRETGQSLIELALTLPLLLLVAFGIVELSYALLHAHVATSVSREGSNLISRNTTLQDAATAMRQLTARPLNLEDGSARIVFSVIRRNATPGAPNFGRDVLYQRHTYGGLAAESQLQGGAGAFGPAPDYRAVDPDTDTRLQISNLPVALPPGGMLYVTEVFTRHDRITPLDRLGIPVPERLYSIAYF